MKKPPFIKLYVKDFAFDTQELSNEELGAYMRSFLKAYKFSKIPNKNIDESLFIELENSLSKYSSVCERNKNNRLNSMPSNNESSTSGKRAVDAPVNQEPVTKNQEPRTNKEPPIIPQGIDKSLWNDFLKQRKILKCSNSDRAINILVNKINRFIDNGHNPNDLIETAIEHNWKTLYEPKGNTNGNKDQSIASDYDGKKLMDFGGDYSAYKEYLNKRSN